MRGFSSFTAVEMRKFPMYLEKNVMIRTLILFALLLMEILKGTCSVGKFSTLRSTRTNVGCSVASFVTPYLVIRVPRFKAMP